MKIRNRILVLALLCVAGASNASEIIIDTFSYHLKPSYTNTTNWYDKNGTIVQTETNQVPYNNINPGIGYKTDSGWMGGFYHNSYNRPTFYGAKEFMFTDQFGIILGAGTGYRYATGKPVSPIGGLEYKIPLTEKITFNTVILPPLIPHSTTVIHFGFSFKL